MVRLARVAAGVVGWLCIAFQPGLSPAAAALLVLLGLYILFALAMLRATRDNWWLDGHAALPEAIIDLFVIGTLIVATGGYASPFFALGVLSIIGALIRWGWRESLVMAGLFLVTFLIASAVAYVETGLPPRVDPIRLTVRLGTLSIVMIFIGWVGVRPARGFVASVRPTSTQQGLIADAMARIANAVGGARSALGIAADRDDQPMLAARPPLVTALPAGLPLPAGPILFDLPRQRRAHDSDRLFDRGACSHALPERSLCEAIGVTEGLMVPFQAACASGVFVLGGLARPDLEMFKLAPWIAAEVARACDDEAARMAQRDVAVLGAKLDAAQDIHDTVAQSLAGTAFRLQALKAWIAAGKDAGPEIERLITDVRGEQTRVRDYIHRLRSSAADQSPCDLHEALSEAAGKVGRTWGLTTIVTAGERRIAAPAWLCEEVAMLVSEAASNAVRHGHAREITFELRGDAREARLTIEDDGIGMKASAGTAGRPVLPWSLNRRVQSLGGALTLAAAPRTRLTIAIPIEAIA